MGCGACVDTEDGPFVSSETLLILKISLVGINKHFFSVVKFCMSQVCWWQ